MPQLPGVQKLLEAMEQFTFKAFAFGGELDLNRLAVKLGIIRKYRWEEPMKLKWPDWLHQS
jgi:hypothetical protein